MIKKFLNPAILHFNDAGNIHRIDGPAVEYNDGKKAWFLNNKEINVSSQQEFERYINLLAFI